MAISGFLQKLLFINQFGIDKGKIQLLGESQIMLNASALLELQSIDTTKMYDIAKGSSLKNMGDLVQHAKVYGKMKDTFLKEIASLAKKVEGSDQGAIKALQEIFNVYGLGEMQIQDIKNDKKQATVVVKNSTLAEEWIKINKGKHDGRACTITAGVVSGIFSYIFKKQIDCVESKCKAHGDEFCLFSVG